MATPTESLPANLKAYTTIQDYSRYTSRDQASWRYIMRQSRRFFQEHAHPVYMEGLEKTGISIDEIPRIDVMDEKLSQFGWGAICVTGFIPPAAFLEFQARSLLPIAADMRTLEHIAYTPAPDIVHEAAGHAPIIADKDYANYLKKYARLARKAIYSDQDVNLYEAVRMLSDMKENPDATADVVAQAEVGLDKAIAAFSYVSESAQITRMYWWTAEYGLIQGKDGLKIYGAGLLSSLGESHEFQSDKVKKIKMSIDCINIPFNITEPQPQLFVAEGFSQLVNILDEMERTMAFRLGGIESLKKAQLANAISTTVLDSGISISGNVASYRLHGTTDIAFIKWQGPVQLAVGETQLPGHGRERHPEGFGTPIGFWRDAPKSNPASFSDTQLKGLGIEAKRAAALEFASGFRVSGRVEEITRNEAGQLILITWSDCTVALGEEVFFRPEWGQFDMAVGITVPSVYGGPADFAAYGDYNFGTVSSQPGRQSAFTSHEKSLFTAYQALRDLRKGALSLADLELALTDLATESLEEFPDEWLLAVEILEVYEQKLGQNSRTAPLMTTLKKMVLAEKKFDQTTNTLIRNGLSLIEVSD
jgi:phenylalanine-4-hydroxylase